MTIEGSDYKEFNVNGDIECEMPFICELLNRKQDTVRKLIARGTLDKQLQKKGYSLVEHYKKSNKHYFKISKVIDNSYFLEKEFKIDNQLEFAKFFIKMDKYNVNMVDENGKATTNKEGRSVKEIGRNLNVSLKTIYVWRDKLEIRNLIKEDGFFYCQYFQGHRCRIGAREYKMHMARMRETFDDDFGNDTSTYTKFTKYKVDDVKKYKKTLKECEKVLRSKRIRY